VLQTRLLQEAGVACLAGTAFGAWGEGYLRLSYANSLDNINRAVDAVGKFLASLGSEPTSSATAPSASGK
jgi:aspartate/methionine/tyrosine aminotransferase